LGIFLYVFVEPAYNNQWFFKFTIFSKFVICENDEAHKKTHLNFALIYIITYGLINKINNKKMIQVIVVVIIAGQWL